MGPLLAAPEDDEWGALYVITDEGHRLFAGHTSPPVPLVPLVLDHNVRNAAGSPTPFIRWWITRCASSAEKAPPLRMCRAHGDGVGDDEVELLLEQGWRPEYVALVTTGSRHPEQFERQAAGSAAY